MTEGGPAAAPETDDRCVHQIVAGLARDYPARPAVTDGATTLTYGELNSNANRLASYLSKFGLAEPSIGLLLPRSADFVTAALAVLKAGGNYVPLDPDYPAERLQTMLAAAGCPVVISTTALIGCLPASSEAVRLRLDELAGQLAELPDTDPAGPAHADGLAYTMFTSGSTGVPKGVMITHRGIVRLVRPPGIVTIGATDVVLHASSVSFDAATFDIWGALVNGARLVIAPAGRTSVLDIAATIAEHQVTTVLLPTGLFHLTVDEQLQALRPLRQLVVGGDVLSAKHASRFQAAIPDCPLVNAYGPTEVTVATATQVVSAGADEDDAVPIGRAMAGTYIRLLDDDLRQVEPGIAGQLYAGGTGLAARDVTPEATRLVCDRMVDGLLRQARDEFDSVFAASEGMVIKLGSTDGTLETHMPVTRTALRREAQFRAKVSGFTEGGRAFEEETVVRDLALQGALISMQHCPRLQSELQITMETPGVDGPKAMKMRGYVVRIETSEEKGHSAVGVVFTE